MLGMVRACHVRVWEWCVCLGVGIGALCKGVCTFKCAARACNGILRVCRTCHVRVGVRVRACVCGRSTCMRGFLLEACTQGKLVLVKNHFFFFRITFKNCKFPKTE